MGSGGSFIAILLSVPLTAVALVGVVGVPKLQELISSTTSSHHDHDDEFDPDGFSSRSRSKRSPKALRDADEWDPDGQALPADSSDNSGDDFGSKPRSTRSKSSLSRSSKPKAAADSFESDLAEESKDDFFSKPSRTRFGGQPQREPGANEMAATDPFKSRPPVMTADHVTTSTSPRGDNFAASVDKLRAMGVEQFYLIPGLGAGQFLFVCELGSTAEAGTVHRFEAEAADPSLAVADVMKQVAAWQAESSVTKTAGVEFRR